MFKMICTVLTNSNMKGLNELTLENEYGEAVSVLLDDDDFYKLYQFGLKTEGGLM